MDSPATESRATGLEKPRGQGKVGDMSESRNPCDLQSIGMDAASPNQFLCTLHLTKLHWFAFGVKEDYTTPQLYRLRYVLQVYVSTTFSFRDDINQ